MKFHGITMPHTQLFFVLFVTNSVFGSGFNKEGNWTENDVWSKNNEQLSSAYLLTRIIRNSPMVLPEEETALILDTLNRAAGKEIIPPGTKFQLKSYISVSTSTMSTIAFADGTKAVLNHSSSSYTSGAQRQCGPCPSKTEGFRPEMGNLLNGMAMLLVVFTISFLWIDVVMRLIFY